MKILAIVPARRKTGASLYSNKLYRRLPAQTVPGEDPLFPLLSKCLKRDTDLYHIQFEYRGFGSLARSIILLALLTLILSLRRPVVITLHGLIVSESVAKRRFGWLTYFAFFAGVRFAGFSATAFIVHSELMKKVLKEVYGIEKGVVIPHGTDADDVGLRRAENPNSLLFYGFIRPSKGIENLIDALAIVKNLFPDVRLKVAGSLARPEEARYLRYLHRRVQQLNLENNVTFRDTFSKVNERTQLMGDAVTVVLPYTDNFVEVSGVVHDLAEYGVPIICSRAPRFSELANEFDCLKVYPSPQNLADAIIRLLRSQELRSRLGTSLQLRAKLESWDLVARQHLSLYQELISRTHSGPLRRPLEPNQIQLFRPITFS